MKLRSPFPIHPRPPNEVLAGDYPVALADWSPSPGDAFDCAAPLYVAVASPEHGCGKPDEGSQALALPAGARSLRAENANLRLSVAHTVALRRIRRQDAVIADLKVISWTTPQGSPHESLRAQP